MILRKLPKVVCPRCGHSMRRVNPTPHWPVWAVCNNERCGHQLREA